LGAAGAAEVLGWFWGWVCLQPAPSTAAKASETTLRLGIVAWHAVDRADLNMLVSDHRFATKSPGAPQPILAWDTQCRFLLLEP
jgi:hypothetical protein